ncbi:MAG TPA: helix-turn-helix domain-containing protein [Sphingomicrobium sp.]|jgi:DNA-binding transcriptional ArsR family regulator|nr:helix-turn-helix domain-containing protein [Sphingomicrobium sp.]
MSIPDSFDRIFKALANPVRRQILDDLKDQPLTTGSLCAHFPELDRCTVMMHLKVLEDAALVIPVRKGRERWNHLNPLPIHDIHERWIGPHAAGATARLAKLKRELEKPPAG